MKKEKLEAHGWSETEIKHTQSELEKVASHDVHFSKIVFWSALVVIIFANLIVSLVLIPFLIALQEWFLYLIIAILAATVGFLYNFLIMDIGHLEKKHHLAAGIIIPIIALVNMIIMVLVANKFIADLNVDNVHSPWLVAVVFAVAFILPYIVDKIRKK
tara:strand:- start:115 stop:591 length:477 start_codon:yes stop_codon:yes gene_type:complete